MAEALERYEREVTVSKRGKVQESSVIGLLLDSKIARLTLARVRSADVATLAGDWRKAGYAPATISRRLAILSHVFQTAARAWGMESLANPVRLVKLAPLRNARDRRVSDSEIEAVCKATRSDILPHIVRLAVETAMRRAEIVATRWPNVDIKRRVLHIPSTKNGYPRDVPLSSRAVAVLSAMKAERDEKRKAKQVVVSIEQRKKDEDDRMFTVHDDVVTQAFDRAVKRARAAYESECERAGCQADAKYLTDLRFHDLRHEATSRLASLLGVHELAKVTGHRDLRMVMRYYHPRVEDLAAKLG